MPIFETELRAGPAVALVERVLRYGTVGLAVSVTYSLAVIIIMSELPALNAAWASGLAFAALLPIAWLGHRHIAFRGAVSDPFQSLRFAFTATSSFFAAVGGIYLVTEVFGRPYLFGIALSWALIPATNFFIYQIWVFRLEPRRPVTAGGERP